MNGIASYTAFFLQSIGKNKKNNLLSWNRFNSAEFFFYISKSLLQFKRRLINECFLLLLLRTILHFFNIQVKPIPASLQVFYIFKTT